MKKIYLLIFLSFVVVSCKLTTPYSYEYTMVEPVEKKSPFTYIDDKIDITLEIEEDGVSFNLKNISDTPLKINWDEMSLVLDNKANRLMHKGIAYADRAKSQAISVIPPNTTLEDIVMPTINISFISGKEGGWKIKPLYNVSTKTIQDLKGKKLALYFPMEFNDNKINYNFEFEIDKIFIKGKEIK